MTFPGPIILASYDSKSSSATGALRASSAFFSAGFDAIGEPLLILLLYLALFFGIIVAGGWRLSPRVGVALLVCQSFYTLWTLARHLPSGRPLLDF